MATLTASRATAQGVSCIQATGSGGSGGTPYWAMTITRTGGTDNIVFAYGWGGFNGPFAAPMVVVNSQAVSILSYPCTITLNYFASNSTTITDSATVNF